MSLTVVEQLKKALELYQSKEYDASIGYFKKVIEIESKNPDHFEKLAMCYFHLGKLDNCVKYLSVAIKLDPNNSFRYSSRAFVKNGVGDVEGAIEDYNTAIHLDPDDAIAHNNLGLLQEKKGFESQAKNSFKKADSLSKDFFNPENQPKNENRTPPLQKEKVQISAVEPSISGWTAIKEVFFTKKGMKEFLSFLKNGFKLKE